MSNNTPATDHSPDAGKMVETPTAGQNSAGASFLTKEAEERSIAISEILRERDELKARKEKHSWAVLVDIPNLKKSVNQWCEIAMKSHNPACAIMGGEDCDCPQGCAELKAEVERLQNAHSFSLKELDRGNEIIDQLRIERGRMRAENAELRKDKERLALVLASGLTIHPVIGGGYGVWRNGVWVLKADTQAEAIDAALAKHADNPE